MSDNQDFYLFSMIVLAIGFFGWTYLYFSKKEIEEKILAASNGVISHSMNDVIDDVYKILSHEIGVYQQFRIVKSGNTVFVSEPNETCATMGDPLGRGYVVLQIKITPSGINVYRSYNSFSNHQIEELKEVVLDECARIKNL